MLIHLKTLADYLDLVIRRKVYIIVICVLISLISVIVAYNLPKTYRSTAKMLIEAPIPTNIIDSTLSQIADLQIQSIYQKVLTTDNVISIIKSHELYNNLTNGNDKYALVELFKKNVEVSLVTSSLVPQVSSGKAEIAFDISFIHSEAIKAKEIASALAALFIEENDKTRTRRAIKTTDFLMEESDKLKQELQEIDSKIVRFKEQNNIILPEQVQGNLAAIDRAENELRDTDMQIRATKERIAFLVAELARARKEIPGKLDDNAPQSREHALSILRAKYLRLSSIYSPSHPSVVRLEREIKALDSTFEGQPIEEDVLKQLAEARRELKLLDESYGANHPDIGKRRKQIDMLEQQLKNIPPRSQQEGQVGDLYATNPAYLGVEAQYISSQSELQSLMQKQDYLKAKLEKKQSLILQAPHVEMAYNELIRTRDNTIKKYTQLREKLLDAKLVQSLEAQQQGQTLTIIEQPVIPRHPEKAIRRKVAIGGFFMGIIGGLGVAFFIEFLEPGIRGYRAISEVTGLVPLVVVPYIESPSETEERLVKQNRMRKVIVWTGVAAIVLAAVVICILFLPLVQT